MTEMYSEISLGTHGLVAGVDEAGRGPWAGPVVTAAVILPPDYRAPGLTDSKKVTAGRRAILFDQICRECVVSVAASSVNRIAELNILGATLDAMRRAVENLPQVPGLVLVDGTHVPSLQVPAQAVVKGDSRVPAISAASIIAKVLRDRIMANLATRYSVYGWDRNAGYGVPQHKNALNQWGVTPHHRATFAPIRKLLNHKE